MEYAPRAGPNMTTATAYDVITSMTSNSIGTRRIYHEDILTKAGRISKWKLTQQKQEERNLLEIKIEFLDLAEGYAVYREQIASLNAAELTLLAEQERLRNTGLTRKQKLKNIEKALAKINKTKAKMA
jgi:hypothetical protein